MMILRTVKLNSFQKAIISHGVVMTPLILGVVYVAWSLTQ